MLAVGRSRPLCLEAALAHVTLHTNRELCPIADTGQMLVMAPGMPAPPALPP